MTIFTLTYLFFSGLVVSTLSAKVIVDDADPRWSFSGPWNVITPSDPCPGCGVHPDPSGAFNHTWHDASGISSASLLFHGVSIQIYTICPPVNGSLTYYTDFKFTFDNIEDGFYVGPTPACPQFMYNYLVYTRTNLADAPHVIEITNNVTPFSALLLDYAIYDDGTSVPAPTVTDVPVPAVTATVTGSTKGTRTSVPIGAIVATSVIAALLLIASLALLFWHRRSRKLQGHDHGVTLPASPMQQQLSSHPVHPISDTTPLPYLLERPGRPLPPSGLPSLRILPETPMPAAPSENLSSVLKADAPPSYESVQAVGPQMTD